MYDHQYRFISSVLSKLLSVFTAYSCLQLDWLHAFVVAIVVLADLDHHGLKVTARQPSHIEQPLLQNEHALIAFGQVVY